MMTLTGRAALFAVMLWALSTADVLAQGLVTPEDSVGARFGTQLLWSLEGLECIAGCDGTAQPIRLGGGTNWDVTVSNFVFTPEVLEITAGDSVTWTNAGGLHNVQADDGSFRCANGCDGAGGDGDPATNGWVVTLTFLDAASIPYFCEVHGGGGGDGMSGVIQVAPPVIFEDGFETGDTSNWSSQTGN